MKYLFLVVAAVLLGACGKCEITTVKKATLTFGTLEEISCPDGQLVERVVPHVIAGGIVTHYTADCVARESSCQ